MLVGFPVVDVRAVLVDSSYHEVDSSFLTFQLAARGAYREGIRKARPRINTFGGDRCSSMSALSEKGRKVEHPTPCNCPSSDAASQRIQNELASKEQEVAA
ncbi:hypothetical protein GOBAR_AA13366 [Gossypium barbadense]|uniref:Translation elongation factor EFG/EF2 domain-containing protein n=1 Tax=Gossypium barbadense TaxID=3634 RepID=A0A2P5XVB6_GOSBA|nr:hypothetical protein GOBAR_AA13366 [Gossypium barbadense]